MKFKAIFAVVVLFLIGGLLVSTGCRREVSKAAYEKQVVRILKDVEEKIKPNLDELDKLSAGKDKERKRLENQQIEIIKDARERMARITPPGDFFSGHSNLVEFLDLFVQLREKQAGLSHTAATSALAIEQRQKLQENYQMVTVAFTRASGELTFLQNEMRAAFYDLLRYQSRFAF